MRTQKYPFGKNKSFYSIPEYIPHDPSEKDRVWEIEVLEGQSQGHALAEFLRDFPTLVVEAMTFLNSERKWILVMHYDFSK